MEPVPVSWWFALEAIVVGAAVAVVGVSALVTAIVWHGRRRHVVAVVGGICVLVVTAMTVTDSPRRMRDLDFHLNQGRREAVVIGVQHGTFTETDGYGRVILPASLADLSMNGRVDIDRGSAGWVFFTRVVGFSPDPYCGYEYAPDAAQLEVDPLGSGHGVAESLGGEWYWICAS